MLSILNPASSISVLTRITNTSSRSNLYGHIISVYRTCAVFDPADPCSFLFTLHSRELGSIPIRKCSICGIFVVFFLSCFCLVCLPQFQFLLVTQPSQTLPLLLSQTSSVKSQAPAFSSPSGHAHPQFLHLQTMLDLWFSTHQAQQPWTPFWIWIACSIPTFYWAEKLVLIYHPDTIPQRWHHLLRIS